MGANYSKSLYRDYERLSEKYDAVSEEYRLLQREFRLREQELRKLHKLQERQQEEILDLQAQNAALKKEVARLTALRNADSTNSGIPTSQTPIHKKKHIPNSRKKSGRHIGGQPGHSRKKLEPFHAEEVTEHETHAPEVCPACGGPLEAAGPEQVRDELEYEVCVRKIRHHFPLCRCKACGKTTRAQIPQNLSADIQYGARVRALALALGNDGNVSIQKIGRTIRGLTEGGICPSDGYIAKQQRWASQRLATFRKELAEYLRGLALLYWDDTVIMIHKRRGCLRFYGNEQAALYCAHEHKDKAGLDRDRILSLLPESTHVMHDHNRVNYHEDYSFSNIECNVHLLRDLQKVVDHLGHGWAKDLRALLEKTNADRNERLGKGEKQFPEETERAFYDRFDQLLLQGFDEHREEREDRYYRKEEHALLARLAEYKDNYLAWVSNFQLPFSNNLSERALRGVKSKQKVAGQFQNVETARCYASIRSYIETCHRNGINAVYALERLCCGNPLSLHEILSRNADTALSA